jgi:hypothetical protein
MQFVPILIPGDHRMTLEGNTYGLYMFEANHQCVSHITVSYTNGKKWSGDSESPDSYKRCDPYAYWYHLSQACKRDPQIQTIAWTLDHSINGGPFYRIVDVPDACALTYQPFTHNAWIKIGKDNPAIVGYPAQNYFYDRYAH